MVDVRLWRRDRPQDAGDALSVPEIVTELDQLVKRLSNETDRLEAANDRAENAIKGRSEP